MPAFEQFLSSFEQGLAALQHRIEHPEVQRPAVRYRPNAAEAGANEVQIGVGRFVVPHAGVSSGEGICLNNKAAAAGWAWRPRSLR